MRNKGGWNLQNTSFALDANNSCTPFSPVAHGDHLCLGGWETLIDKMPQNTRGRCIKGKMRCNHSSSCSTSRALRLHWQEKRVIVPNSPDWSLHSALPQPEPLMSTVLHGALPTFLNFSMEF